MERCIGLKADVSMLTLSFHVNLSLQLVSSGEHECLFEYVRVWVVEIFQAGLKKKKSKKWPHSFSSVRVRHGCTGNCGAPSSPQRSIARSNLTGKPRSDSEHKMAREARRCFNSSCIAKNKVCVASHSVQRWSNNRTALKPFRVQRIAAGRAISGPKKASQSCWDRGECLWVQT